MKKTKKYVLWVAEKGCYDPKEYVRYIFEDDNGIEIRSFVKAMRGVLFIRDGYWTYDKDPKYHEKWIF